MARIHVLDETTINKIAAGEVVERPASVIKELVENSIDAGAKTIEVEIEEGGIRYMRIRDDGCGMAEEDARLSVLRHATSKIHQVEDLFDIASLGFRGEALASIASVSHFILTTRTSDQDMGTRITIDGGAFGDCLPFGAAPGTTIEVKDLFYNTPARRKFLKTPRTETSKIQDIIGKLALGNTNISFKLIVDGKMSIITPGSGDVMDAVTALYGYKTREDIFPVAYEADRVFVEGVVSKPTLIKSTRIWQTIIVNNRVVSDRAISKAIDNAYHALLPKSGFPLVILNLIVPPDMVDINVHPRKSEVKFADDKIIFKAVYHAVLQALEDPLHERVSSAGLSSQPLEVEALSDKKEETFATSVNYDKVFSGRHKGFEVLREDTQDFVKRLKAGDYKPQARLQYIQDSFDQSEVFKEAESLERFRQAQATPSQGATPSVDTHRESSQEAATSPLSSASSKEDSLPNRLIQNSGLVPLGQVANCFILAKKGDDLYIIDQHAAHERVRYDTLCKSAEAIPMQELLLPIYLPATNQEMLLVEEERETLLDLGFDVELGGPSQIKMLGSPVDLIEQKAEEVLRYVFNILEEQGQPTKAQLRHEMLAYASCRGAIKAGHSLNMYQMSVLIEDLFTTDKPFVCPHGRPTIIRFTPDELGKLFLRS